MPRPGTTKFLEDPLEFARTHPIIASVNPTDVSAARFSGRDKRRSSTRDRAAMARHTLDVADVLYTARIDKRQQANSDSNLGYVVTVSPFANHDPVPEGRFPIWYLSWNPGGGQIDMRIPADTIVDDAGRDVTPRFFFTAELTGCSVFVRGKHRTPEIAHSGCIGTAWEGPATDHWRGLFNVHRAGSLGRGRAAEVNHTDYVGETLDRQDATLSLHHTARIEAYVQRVIVDEMAANPFQSLKIKGIMGIGCVFGIRRDDGRWRFYLQENVRIFYSRGAEEGYCVANRALRVKQIWPQGGPPALVNPYVKGLP